MALVVPWTSLSARMAAALVSLAKEGLRRIWTRLQRQGTIDQKHIMKRYRCGHIFSLSCEGRTQPSVPNAMCASPPQNIRGLAGRVAKQGWERLV
jgi:hypothetical protein